MTTSDHSNATSAKHLTSRRRQLLRGLVLGLAVVALGTASILGYISHAYATTLPANVTVAGVELGGLTPPAAQVKLQQAIEAVNDAPITITLQETTVSRSPDDLDVMYDTDATVRAAMAVARTDNQVLTAWQLLTRLFSDPINVPLVVSFDRPALAEAIEELSEKLGTPTTDARLVYAPSGLSISGAKAGEAIDSDPLAAALETKLVSLDPARNLPAKLTTREPAVSTADAEQLLPALKRLIPSRTVSLTVENGPTTAVDAKTLASFVSFEPLAGQAATAVLVTAKRANGQPGSVVAVLNQDAIASYLKTLASKLDQPAVDAKLVVKDGRATVFQASRDGRSLNQAEALTAVSSALVKEAQQVANPEGAPSGQPTAETTVVTVALPVETTKAAITDSTVSSLGITQLIGKGTTDFSGSPTNRVHNITTGVKYLAGLIVKPGEEFSTVGALGAIDASTGYLPELVIVNNKTFPEFGGGLCQVSTTLFRAVLNAGLPVTARTNHSYRVVYYERGVGPGLDATIYSPSPDFKFKNDTSASILVQGSISGNSLTFELYGTSDGRTSTIAGPYTTSETPPPPDEYQKDDSLQPGEKKQIQFSHPGATTTATYTVHRDGKQINQQVFNSSYRAMPAVYAEGPKKE